MGQDITLRASFDSTDSATGTPVWDRCSIFLSQSKVRKRYGWWASFPYATNSEFRHYAVVAHDNGESDSNVFELRGKARARRRYQFKVAFSNHHDDAYEAREMVIYFPSSSTYTRNPVVDLGNLWDYFN